MRVKIITLLCLLAFIVSGVTAKTCLENLNSILEYKAMSELRKKLIAETVSGKRNGKDLLEKALSANELDQFLLGGEKYGFLPRDTYSRTFRDDPEIREIIFDYAFEHPKLIDAQLLDALIKNCKDPREIETLMDFFYTGYFRKMDYYWKRGFDFDYDKLALTIRDLIKKNEVFLKENQSYGTGRDIWTILKLFAKNMEIFETELSKYGIKVPNFFPEERPISWVREVPTLVPNMNGPERLMR